MKTISDLKANPENPRTISEEAKKRLKRTLIKFGDLSGIVDNVRSGNVVGGHQRLSVLPPGGRCVFTKKFDRPTKTGTVALGYFKVGLERYPYRQVDWDEATEKAANLAANKSGGEFELKGLKKWLGELNSIEFDLGLTGFDEEELEGLLGIGKDFGPGSEEDQGQLDEKKKTVCPHCGEEFLVGGRK